jgi:hypothetical protein
MIPKKPATDPIGGGNRFSEKIMPNEKCKARISREKRNTL